MTLHALTLRRPWPSAIFLPGPIVGYSDDIPELYGLGAPEGGYGYEDHEVAIGPKLLENRGQLPPSALFGQLLAIHAGLGYDEVEWPGGLEVPREPDCPTGIVGVVRLIGALDRRRARNGMRRRAVHIRDEGDRELRARLAHVDRDHWWTGPVGWVLEDPIAIEPVPCRGAQGVWTVPMGVAAEVRRRVEGVRARRA